MKRFVIALAISLLSASAFAQVADRDMLVTPEGTVYTVEQRTPSESSGVAATSILELSIQSGSSEAQHVLVPESLSRGFHSDGTLAYDASSRTLFVLWTHMPNGGCSELLLASYREGKWQPAVSIDFRGNSSRANLRLGITRRVSQLQKDGTYADAPALILHALWWDSNGRGEEARYAMLPIENGALSQDSVEFHSLEEFVGNDENDETINTVDAKFNPEILHHPAIVSSPMQSSVDVVFGDPDKKSIHKVTLHPIAEHRIHIPVGIGGGGKGGVKPLSVTAPANFTADWRGPITVIERGDTLVFANATDKALNYLTYSDGAWTEVKSIALSSKLTVETALAAVDKMVSSQ
ncbi:MAG: hypothetical protein QOE68_2657 [Thermoanaerobaculia bacterium]|jgi:hypothetical protein|nr:hypothetical protein [Thermoanaerobaculia bacterium]